MSDLELERRDRIAIAAMQALLPTVAARTLRPIDEYPRGGELESCKAELSGLAADAYLVADAMLEASRVEPLG